MGGLIPTAVGLVDTQGNEGLQKDILTVLILTPAILSALQFLILLFIYRIDTPVYYH